MADVSPQPAAAPAPMEVDGSRLTFLTEGPARLDALIALIDGARETLRILYYIFADDESGRRVRERLLAARGRGVEVAVLVDGFGTENVRDSFFQPLVEGNCRFCRFEPRWGRRYLLRNHQKLALADQDTALTGGFNISNDYFGTAREGAWRDLGVLVEGPAAGHLAAYFDDLFGWAQMQTGRIRALRRLLERHSQQEGRLRWMFAGPEARLSPWARTIKRDMLGATSFDLVAAYFAPNWGALRRFYPIGRRGRARIVTAAKSDNGATIGAARHTYWRLLRRGIEIFEYQPTKLHTKLIVVDRIVHVGSANFDMRSLYLNLEIMLRIEDDAVAQAMHSYVDGEIADSVQIHPVTFRRHRSLFNRLKWALCYFIVATMDYNVTRRLNFGIKGR